MDKQAIEFVRPTSLQEGDIVYKPGDRLECGQATADRWIRRGAAKAVVVEKKTTPKQKDK